MLPLYSNLNKEEKGQLSRLVRELTDKVSGGLDKNITNILEI